MPPAGWLERMLAGAWVWGPPWSPARLAPASNRRQTAQQRHAHVVVSWRRPHCHHHHHHGGPPCAPPWQLRSSPPPPAAGYGVPRRPRPAVSAAGTRRHHHHHHRRRRRRRRRRHRHHRCPCRAGGACWTAASPAACASTSTAPCRSRCHRQTRRRPFGSPAHRTAAAPGCGWAPRRRPCRRQRRCPPPPPGPCLGRQATTGGAGTGSCSPCAPRGRS